MRLFRQKAHGDWHSVVSQLDEAFDAMLLLDTKALAAASCLMSLSIYDSFDESEAFALVRRMELLPQLIRRQQEELILDQVPLPFEWIEEQRRIFLGDQSLSQALEIRGWTEQDLEIHLRRPEALRRFARQRFGPGLEDAFLASRGGRDQVIYSLLRVRDGGLARELWIRLEEGETTFAEAAHQQVGEEAQRKGVIGPFRSATFSPMCSRRSCVP